jgi:hypothetical protein
MVVASREISFPLVPCLSGVPYSTKGWVAEVKPNPSTIQAQIVTTLMERDALGVTVYPDCVEISGGHDSNDLVLTVEGVFTQDEVARWFGVPPELIEVSDLGAPSVGQELS